jgi:hypothetical protein
MRNTDVDRESPDCSQRLAYQKEFNQNFQREAQDLVIEQNQLSNWRLEEKHLFNLPE